MNNAIKKELKDNGVMVLTLNRPEVLNAMNRDLIMGLYETFQEIETYSNSINKKYIFGIYDCRHYVDKMSVFCDTGNIPIWNLKSYF